MLAKEMEAYITGGSAVRAMFEEGNRLAAQYGRENVYDFSLGNPNIPAPAEVNDAIRAILAEEESTFVHGYMTNAGYPDVRRAVAEDLNARFGADYTQDNILMTVGAAGGLNTILRVLLDPEDEVIVFAPYFSEYNFYVRGARGVIRPIPADPITFQPDPEALREAVTPRTKALLLNNPNNPTGVVYSEETLRAIAAVLTEKSREIGHPIYILSDEPYRELVYDGVTAPWIPALYPDTVVGYSWSKSLSLPGERIGYLCIPSSCADFPVMFDAAVAVNPWYLAYVNRLAQGATSNGSTLGYSPETIFQESLWNWVLGNSQEVQEQVEDTWDYVDNHDGTATQISFVNPPQVDGEGTFWFRFDQRGKDNAAVVSAYVYQLSDDGKHAIALGETYDVYGDWETGQFADGFNGRWLSLPDGQNLNLIVQSADETTIVYTSPIELNGQECYLRIRQDVASGQVTVDGAWGALDGSGALDRSVRPIVSGDTILPLYRAVTVAESQRVDDYEGEVYTVGSGGLTVSYDYLPIGAYLYSFCIQDIYGDLYCTENIQFEIDGNGDIYF